MLRFTFILSTVAFPALPTGAMAGKPVPFQGLDQNIVQQCLTKTCQVAITLALMDLKKLNLSDEDLNSEIGIMAVSLFELARSQDDPKIHQQIAVAIQRLGEFSTDDAQKTAMRRVSHELKTGSEDLFDLDDPFAASPM